MDMFEFLRGFFRYPNNRFNDERGPPSNSFRNPIWSNDDDDDADDELHSDSRNGLNFGFNIFSSPLEMQRYFEQQMNQLIRSFHSGMSDSLFFEGMNPMFEHNIPIESWSNPGISGEQFSQKKSLRDEFLKPGYETIGENLNRRNNESDLIDSDLDGQLYGQQLDSFLKRNSPDTEVPGTSELIPYDNKPKRGIFGFNFGQSIMSKTVMRPDGSVEMHKTVRDSSGNEETTITIQKPQETYTKVIRKDSHGVITETEEVTPRLQ